MATEILFLFVAVLYCVIRGTHDLIEKRYRWGVAGIAAAVLLMMAPNQTRAVKIDLPSDSSAR